MPNLPAAARQRRRSTRMRPKPGLQAKRKPGKAWPDVRSATIGALVAALITGVLGYFSMYRQNQAEDTRAMKERQQVAYSALITDERMLSQLEKDFFFMIIAKRPEVELAAQKQRVDEAHVKLSQDVSNVALVGSAPAAIIASGIESNHLIVNSSVFIATTVADSDDFARKVADDYFNRVIAKELDTLPFDFIQQGRRDIGTRLTSK